MRALVLSIILLFVLSSPRAQIMGADGAFVSADVGLSIFGEAAHRAYLARSLALAIRGGQRWGDWGGFLQIEPAFWIGADGADDDAWSGVLNVGLGAEYIYSDGFVRTSLVVGPSVLLTGTSLDEPGQTGFFFELRPTGLRWAMARDWTIGLDPIVLSFTAPVLDGIPLVELEYRTTLSGEFYF